MKNGLVIDENGSKRWHLNDLLHREDGPAWIWPNGSKFWYLNGKEQRDDGPASEWADGTQVWYLHGRKHRVDGPAIEREDGGNEWWLNGKKLFYPESFSTMEEWIKYLNVNESETYQLIHDIDGLIELINKPSAKQMRVHQMKWVL